MATSLNTIRRLTIEATTPGVTEATGKLSALATAQEGVARASGSSERATVSLERALDRIQRRVDMQYRADQEMAKMTRDLDRARAQGLITMERQNQLLDMAKSKFGGASAAVNDNATQLGLARHEMINFGRQMQDVATMAAMGMSPMAILSSQGAQVADIFMSSQGTMKGFFGQIMDGARSVLTPMRLVAGAGVHGGKLPWNPMTEMPAIIRLEEGVFTPAQMKALGAGRGGGQQVVQIGGPSITIQGNADAGTVRMIEAALKEYTDQMPGLVRGANDFNRRHSSS